MMSTAVERKERENGGQEAVIQRRVGTIHVAGTSVKPSFAPAKSVFPTMDELTKSSTWEVVDGVDVRSIGVVNYTFTIDPMFVPGATVSASAGQDSKGTDSAK